MLDVPIELKNTFVRFAVVRIMPEGPCIEHAAYSFYTIEMASRPVAGTCEVCCVTREFQDFDSPTKACSIKLKG